MRLLTVSQREFPASIMKITAGSTSQALYIDHFTEVSKPGASKLFLTGFSSKYFRLCRPGGNTKAIVWLLNINTGSVKINSLPTSYF